MATLYYMIIEGRHTAITGKIVRIINTCVLSSAEPTMIKFTFMLSTLVILILYSEDFVSCVRVDYLSDSWVILGWESFVHALFHDLIETVEDADIVCDTVIIVYAPYFRVIRFKISRWRILRQYAKHGGTAQSFSVTGFVAWVVSNSLYQNVLFCHSYPFCYLYGMVTNK